MKDLRKIVTLTKFFGRDLLQTRIAKALVVIWALLLVVSFGVNTLQAKQRTEVREREYKAQVAYLEARPNYRLVLTNFVTRARPIPPHFGLVNGVEYTAPDLLDLRIRESPAFYYGDDVDPTARLFRPLDLPFIVGIVGFLLTLLLGHDAVNSELENGNARFLSLFGVRLWHVFVSKTLVLGVFLGGSFALVYALGLIPVFWLSPSALRPSLPQLATLGGLSLVYLLYAVASISAISVVCTRRATAFLVGAGLFLVTVYAVPNTAVFIERLRTTKDDGAIAERAQAVARDAHSRLDLAIVQQNEAMKSVPPDSRQVLGTMRKFAGQAAGTFGKENNEGTMKLNVAELDRLHERDRSIVWMAIPGSPYMATTHAMSIVAGTGIDDDFRLTSYAAQAYQKEFVDWTGRKWMLFPPHPDVEKWIFAQSADPEADAGKDVSLAGVPAIAPPTLSFGAAAKQAAVPGAVTLIYAVLAWLLGLAAARRLGRRERC